MSDHPEQTGGTPSLRHLGQLLAQLLDGVIVMDPAGTILTANDAALRMHGVDRVDELGLTVEGYAQRFSLWDEANRPLKRRDYPLSRLLAGDSFPDLIVAVAPAGEDEARWIHQVRDVTMDQDGGEPDCLALVMSDVSQRFDAEARFKAMFNANPAPALVIRLRDQHIVQANAGFLSLTGFDPDDLLGRTLFGKDLLSLSSEAASVRTLIEDGEPVAQTEAELLVADGSRRLVLFAGQPIDVTQEDALLLTFADLEPRRQADRALVASEQHLMTLFEMAPVAMMVTEEPEHRIVSVNAAFRELTGHEAEDAVGSTADELRLWEVAADRESAEREVEEHGSFRNREARLLQKDGTAADCLVSTETIGAPNQHRLLWLFQDITERRRSEAQLVDAIDAVMKDATWLSRSIVDKLATLRRPGPQVPVANLSTREREILALICDDLDDKAIAEKLDLSRNTVRNHVARIYAKIGVNRRSGAVVWGRERGLGSRMT